MKILICGEGKHDIGVADEWCGKSKAYVSIDGWMQPLIRSIKGQEVSISIRKRRDLTLLPKVEKKFKPLPSGHGAKALMAKLAAVIGKYDAVIFMVDADTTDVARWKEIQQEILTGFSCIEGQAVGIACVPMSASESWLLADAQAWSTITNRTNLHLPSRPEEVWGARNDPTACHPHRMFANLCEQAGESDGHKIRLLLAEQIDLPTLRKNCPVSFEAFYDSLLKA